jgi:Flp pilus assembly protein TadG
MQCRNYKVRRGIAAVELAILLPFLMFVFVIAVDWARVFYFSVTLSNVARQGAIYGSDPVAAKQSPYTSVQDAALRDAANMTPKPTIPPPTYGVDGSGNPYIEVTANWQFTTITNFPGVPSSQLSRTVRMRVAPITPK